MLRTKSVDKFNSVLEILKSQKRDFSIISKRDNKTIILEGKQVLFLKK